MQAQGSFCGTIEGSLAVSTHSDSRGLKAAGEGGSSGDIRHENRLAKDLPHCRLKKRGELKLAQERHALAGIDVKVKNLEMQAI